ncbi:MAG: cytochrome oxidase subunit III [Acidobacteria bacterium RBG_16_68_9]|nr:MAG: cytochrome oxidase subunit III [Acidobacteria bacterium RBG_16_68_9]
MHAHGEHHPALQHHFEDLEQQFEAAGLGMWVFLVTEIMFFGGLFMAYLVYRTWYPDAFAEGSRHLDITLGAVNTAILIASSLTMAMAVYAGQQGDRKWQLIYLALTLVFGFGFLGIKAVEYTEKFRDHLIPGPHFEWHGAANPANVQMFYSLYFAMTGLHALHMVIGAGMIVVLMIMAAKGRFTREWSTPVEVGGLYWHFVDIVWIFLFPLLYLIERHY